MTDQFITLQPLHPEVRRRPLSGRDSATATDDILAQRWPTLAGAMRQYQQNVAEAFTRQAYDRVLAGVIRLDDRRELERVAEAMAIKPFDAQLLIACAVRQWALDHAYDPTPNPFAPLLSYEYRSWGKAWLRWAIVVATAVSIDGIIIWQWLR